MRGGGGKDTCSVICVNKGQRSFSERNLGEHAFFFRNTVATSVMDKVRKKSASFLDTVVSSRKPFGLDTKARPTKDGDITLRYHDPRNKSKNTGPFQRELVTAHREWIDKWKVIISYRSSAAGGANKYGQRKVLAALGILPPGVVCSETYLVVQALDTEETARNLLSYMRTKFVSFLVAQYAQTQCLHKGCFACVPAVDLSRGWSDADLFELYELDASETKMIEETILVPSETALRADAESDPENDEDIEG